MKNSRSHHAQRDTQPARPAPGSHFRLPGASGRGRNYLVHILKKYRRVFVDKPRILSLNVNAHAWLALMVGAWAIFSILSPLIESMKSIPDTPLRQTAVAGDAEDENLKRNDAYRFPLHVPETVLAGPLYANDGMRTPTAKQDPLELSFEREIMIDGKFSANSARAMIAAPEFADRVIQFWGESSQDPTLDEITVFYADFVRQQLYAAGVEILVFKMACGANACVGAIVSGPDANLETIARALAVSREPRFHSLQAMRRTLAPQNRTVLCFAFSATP
jgi:hypothetical protein